MTEAMNNDIGLTSGISSTDDNHHGGTDFDNVAIRERRDHGLLQRQVLQLMGRPYWVGHSNTTCTSVGYFVIAIVGSIIIGMLLGLGAFAILESSHVLAQELWNSTTKQQQHQHQYLLSSFFLVAIRLSLGGFLSSICLWCLPWSPMQQTKHFFHDLIDLDPLDKGNYNNSTSAGQTLMTLLAAWILLLAGAPLGPEFALGAIASLIVKLSTSRSDSVLHCVLPEEGRPKRRLETCWVQASIAGALSTMVPSPLISLLAVQELVLSARPHDITMDAALQKCRSVSSIPFVADPVDNNHRHNINHDNDPAQEEDDSASSVTMEVPLLPAASNAQRQRYLSSLDHDFMELLLLSGCTATLSFIIMQELNRLAHSNLFPWDDFRELLHPQQDSHTKTSLHYLLALPLGFMGGAVALVMLLLAAITRWIRSKSCRWLQSRAGRQQQWLGPVVFSVMAGLVVAGLTLLVPEPWMVSDNGVMMSLHLLQHPQDTVTLQQLLTIMVCRMLSLVVMLGMGWFGGPILPLASIGLCLGLYVSKTCSFLPISLAVPCCVASVTGAVVPIPFTIVLMLIQLFALDMEQGGPILISTIAAHCITGGSGLVRNFGQRLIGIRNGYTWEEHEEDDRAEPLLMAPSDDELLRDIRTAIFGGLS